MFKYKKGGNLRKLYYLEKILRLNRCQGVRLLKWLKLWNYSYLNKDRNTIRINGRDINI